MEKWEQSSQLNFSPTWREWFDFKSKDKGGGSEADPGEAGPFRGRAGLLESVGCHLLFTFFWFFMFSHGQQLVYHLI